nr:MAG TPA: hypothetical protein [Caudoviricetes sp.]
MSISRYIPKALTKCIPFQSYKTKFCILQT